ncbi:MAG: cysteine desulfurase [Corynebacteriales bacterium]|nr:cysteine desulfurase [Mycobacteriales bacterium]
MTFDVEQVRKDFPILSRVLPNGAPLVYLDSGNTSQKPRQVVEAIANHYEQHNANVARAVHTLGTESTLAFEGARDKVAAFINAYDRDEVIFTKNSTEAINMVAQSWGQSLRPGDEIVISEMEHHSNIVPWQLVAQRTGATLRWFSITDEGRLDLSTLDELINERTKIVSYVHASNILGTINPTEAIVSRAHQVGAKVMLDASQSVPHMPVDVQELDVDFMAFTGHKMCGPTGIGVLWGRKALLDEMPPFLGGGEMIETVRMEGSTFAPVPHKFEAGTPPIVQAIGLGAAIDYLNSIGMEQIREHEKALTGYALEALETVPGMRIIGPRTAIGRGGAISFALGDVHPHDVGQLLDEQGIAVRVGHHCAAPTCRRFGVPATTRVSLYFYNTQDEVDALIKGLRGVLKVFG